MASKVAITYYGDTPPNGMNEGDFWVNSTNGNIQIFQNRGLRNTSGSLGGDKTLTGVITTTQGFHQNGEQIEAPAGGGGTTKTLDAADAGVWQDCALDNSVITLPATVVGLVFKVRNSGADGVAKVSISPAAADLIEGNGYTTADDKDAINTKATAKKGDYMVLVGNGTTGWIVADVVGIWAREG